MELGLGDWRREEDVFVGWAVGAMGVGWTSRIM